MASNATENFLIAKTHSKTVDDLKKELHGSFICGESFSVDDTSSVTKICGDIGVVYPPSQYATWPMTRIYSLHGTESGMLGYAAVRFAQRTRHETATFVIDSFGVINDRRTGGLGRKLFEYIREDVSTDATASWLGVLVRKGLMTEDEPYTMSIQSIFDYGSYQHALAMNTKVEDKDGAQVVTIDMTAVLGGVHGSCDFWRKVGFNEGKIMCTKPFNLIEPVIVMWQKLR